MNKIKVAIIGSGNISNTRHIPALRMQKNVEIVGVIGVNEKNIARTLAKNKLSNSLLLKSSSISDELRKCDWFKDVDAVVIGVPPKDHFAMAEASLRNGKHVLCEKPMTMSVKEADELIGLAKQNKKIFCVMHNFQYTNGIQKLSKIISSDSFGELVSFYEFQLTNKYRRLPEWYNDLPLGLFFDEAPHFMYLLEKFGGKLKIEDAYAQFSSDKNSNTPMLMNVSLRAGKYPASIFLNFESPVCEWYFVVCGKNQIAYYDLFKDILVVLPSDNEHYASDVIRNSWKMTYQYWLGFIKNGFRMLTGHLLYGHDEVIKRFINAVTTGKNIDDDINYKRGKATVGYMTEIVNIINKKRSKK